MNYEINDEIWKLISESSEYKEFRNIKTNNIIKIKIDNSLYVAYYAIDPYDYLKNFVKEGDKLWTNTFGEVTFVGLRTDPKIIHCQLDDGHDLYFTHDGKCTYFVDDVWKYDDEALEQLYLAKDSLLWEVNPVICSTK